MSTTTETWTCKECGAPESRLHWLNGDSLAERQLCFNCSFWHDQIGKVTNEADRVVVDGTHYWANRKRATSNTAFAGFGGRTFHIEFLDGRKATSNDVWCQGSIPERFRDRLPDNARFVDGAKWVEIDGVKYLSAAKP